VGGGHHQKVCDEHEDRDVVLHQRVRSSIAAQDLVKKIEMSHLQMNAYPEWLRICASSANINKLNERFTGFPLPVFQVLLQLGICYGICTEWEED
jgi:hypothetical protein